MTSRFTTRFCLLITLLFLGAQKSSYAQSQADREKLYETATIYVSIGKYRNGEEIKYKSIFINPDVGSYAYIVIKHDIFRLPAGTYRIKLWRNEGDAYREHDISIVTFAESVHEMRIKYLFKTTGRFLIDIFDSKGTWVKQLELECKPAS